MYYQQLEAENPMYEDRQAAGRLLGAVLAARRESFSAVIGLTRGGVPIAYEVSSLLGVPMDILVVKKLRSPMSSELAIGAICADGAQVLRREIILDQGVSQAYLNEEVDTRLVEAQDLERLYRGQYPPVDLSDAAVVLVDDGMATGSTMEAAVASVRRRGAKRIVVAVPIGSPDACELLHRTANEVVCLATPYEFWGVGQFYARFPQVEDEDVRELLKASHAKGGRRKPGERG